MKFAQIWPDLERLSRAAVASLSGMARVLRNEGGRQKEADLLATTAGRLQKLNEETSRRAGNIEKAGEYFVGELNEIYSGIEVDCNTGSILQHIVGAVSALAEMPNAKPPDDDETPTDEIVVDED